MCSFRCELLVKATFFVVVRVRAIAFVAPGTCSLLQIDANNFIMFCQINKMLFLTNLCRHYNERLEPMNNNSLTSQHLGAIVEYTVKLIHKIVVIVIVVVVNKCIMGKYSHLHTFCQHTDATQPSIL